MAEQVFRLSPSATRWMGPFVSPYGAHLVLVTGILPGRIPDLEEVADLVRENARRVKLDDARQAVYEKWISRYRIRRELPAESPE
jgi:parvulin-like peptidyl-prolyl isomerase